MRVVDFLSSSTINLGFTSLQVEEDDFYLRHIVDSLLYKLQFNYFPLFFIQPRLSCSLTSLYVSLFIQISICLEPISFPRFLGLQPGPKTLYM